MDEATLKAAHAWIVGRDTGTSSKAIWAHMMGVDDPYWDYPYDPADLGRCLRLLDKVPAWKERLPEMARRSDEWDRLVADWDALHKLMADEVGIDWSKGRSAPRTYERMKVVLGGRAAE